jgi:hypothetical protein
MEATRRRRALFGGGTRSAWPGAMHLTGAASNRTSASSATMRRPVLAMRLTSSSRWRKSLSGGASEGCDGLGAGYPREGLSLRERLSLLGKRSR